MEWHDEGLIIGVKKFGESSVILEVMTAAHGRHLGLVRGGRSKRMQPVLQPGNGVNVTWRARLEDHLGHYAIEATDLRAGQLMAEAAALHGLNLVSSLLRLLAEREPHEPLYRAAVLVADRLHRPDIAPALLARFELVMLAELGFGLDLAACAATGTNDDLTYVSPKSGRAVSRAAGEPYRDRLLALPAFLREDEMDAAPEASDVCEAFALAAYFLDRDVFSPRGLTLPDAHAAYVAAMVKAGGVDKSR
ncbi:MAG: DNA repair protein RecO [Methylovirgula sp.]|jgi:DNA repair protein RecO (recombination protein O)